MTERRIDPSVAAPRWTEAVESLTSQIEGLRSTALADVYTGFGNSVLRERVQQMSHDATAPDETVSLSIDQAVELARSVMSAAPLDVINRPEMREVRGLLDFTPDMYAHLQESAPVYVTEEMMRLADAAADALPCDIEVTAQSLLEPHMWLYFEQGLPMRNVQGRTVVVKAAYVGSEAHEDPTVPGADICFYSDVLDERDTTGDRDLWLRRGTGHALLPCHVGGIAFGTSHPWDLDAIERMDETDLSKSFFMTDREAAADADAVKVAAIDTMRLQRFVVAVVLLMQQKDVRVADCYSRPVNRRWERARRAVGSKTVELKSRVVVLRQKVYDAADSDGKPSMYSHRWWRRGHWRQYQKGKWTYVAGHVCGPEDKAFIPRSNAYTWER